MYSRKVQVCWFASCRYPNKLSGHRELTFGFYFHTPAGKHRAGYSYYISIDMVRTFTSNEKGGYEWIDISSPENGELQEVARKYGLHEESVNDALQMDHIPKYERLKNYRFLIIRVFAKDQEDEADSVKELTNKLTIFISESFLITIHRYDWPPLNTILEEYVK